jgi:hypothetical protein
MATIRVAAYKKQRLEVACKIEENTALELKRVNRCFMNILSFKDYS